MGRAGAIRRNVLHVWEEPGVIAGIFPYVWEEPPPYDLHFCFGVKVESDT